MVSGGLIGLIVGGGLTTGTGLDVKLNGLGVGGGLGGNGLENLGFEIFEPID
jgi:hypothetical protein